MDFPTPLFCIIKSFLKQIIFETMSPFLKGFRDHSLIKRSGETVIARIFLNSPRNFMAIKDWQGISCLQLWVKGLTNMLNVETPFFH